MTIVLLASWIDSDVEWFLRTFFRAAPADSAIRWVGNLWSGRPVRRHHPAHRRPGQGRQADAEQVVSPYEVRCGLQAGFRATGPVREWDGRPQRVMVLDQGFAWNGVTYRSLTEVAFAMTGTRWSGPRFFGLRGRGEKPA
jgi:hypothetical protein